MQYTNQIKCNTCLNSKKTYGPYLDGVSDIMGVINGKKIKTYSTTKKSKQKR